MKPILFIFVIFLFGCKSNDKKIITSGEIINRTYYSHDLDWKIQIPKDYTVDTNEQKENSENSRNKNFKTPKGLRNIPTKLNLITFRKNQDNFFSSSLNSMDKNNLTYKELQEGIVESINLTYSSLKHTKHQLETSEIKIGEIIFNRIQIKVFKKTTGDLIIKQDIYNSLVDNKIFSASINYNSELEKEIMEKAFFESLESKKTLGNTVYNK